MSEAGKGDKQRPTNHEAFSANFNAIDWGKRANDLMTIFKDVDPTIPPIQMSQGRELRFGGRCQRHPLQIIPCSECLREFIEKQKEESK
jgi:hypothetical protein